VILNDADKLPVVDNANPWILTGKLLCNFQSTVGTAVVHDAVLPVRIGLSQDAADAIVQELFAIIDRCDNAHTRTGTDWVGCQGGTPRSIIVKGAARRNRCLAMAPPGVNAAVSTESKTI
jgi:hypothetical protein